MDFKGLLADVKSTLKSLNWNDAESVARIKKNTLDAYHGRMSIYQETIDEAKTKLSKGSCVELQKSVIEEAFSELALYDALLVELEVQVRILSMESKTRRVEMIREKNFTSDSCKFSLN